MKELPISEGGDFDPDKAIEAILSDPEYDYSPSLFGRIMGWIGDRIADLLRPLASAGGVFGGGFGGGLATFVGYLLIIGLVAAAAWLLWRVIRDRLPKPAETTSEPVIEISPWRSADELRADARAFEEEGEWREALRAWYRLSIAELVERDLIENPPGRTSGEYLREVNEGLPSAASQFEKLTQRFELVWYGNDGSSADDVALVRRLVDEVLGKVAA